MMQKKISIFILLMLFVSANGCRSQNVDINEGAGSSWENNALFDFEGNVHKGIEFYTFPYEFE